MSWFFSKFPSFPNFIWERLLFLAKFHFALTLLALAHARSAIKLPQQVRSQVQLGNEGNRSRTRNRSLPKVPEGRLTIARRFIAGYRPQMRRVPSGRLIASEHRISRSGSNVPTGRALLLSRYPAINRRAIFGCPAGTFVLPNNLGRNRALPITFGAWKHRTNC